MILAMANGDRLRAVLGAPLGGKIEGMLVLFPSMAVSWWALSLPRVVVLRCTRCGSLHRQYRTPPGIFRSNRKTCPEHRERRL
jgi:hypothetical protein